MNDSQASYRVGVDVGGTFTDLIAYGADGVLHSAKVPSLPGEQWRGVLDALASLGVEPESIRAFVHGRPSPPTLCWSARARRPAW